jgi:hypothetical protein
MADPQILLSQSDAFVQHLLSLFGNVLDYIACARARFI